MKRYLLDMVNKILLIETNFTSQLWKQFLSNKAQSHEAVSLCEFSSQAELKSKHMKCQCFMNNDNLQGQKKVSYAQC